VLWVLFFLAAVLPKKRKIIAERKVLSAVKMRDGCRIPTGDLCLMRMMFKLLYDEIVRMTDN
jgi:hypothetical protein